MGAIMKLKIDGKWYSIRAEGDIAEVLIYDFIGEDFFGDGVSAKNFAEQISKLDVGTINVRINSPGGDVFDGLAIYNSLLHHKANITVEIDGAAFSIASVIAMAGDTVSMAENAMMMIHDPWTGLYGNAEDLRKEADVLDKVKGTLITSYKRQTSLGEKEISDLMSAETWMNAQEALDNGFVTSITEAKKMAASFDPRFIDHYKNVPEDIKAAAMKEKPPEPGLQTDGKIVPIDILKRKLDMAEIESR